MGYNEWLDIDVLEAYLDGNLDPKTMHKVERASLDDPFVAEALAGLTEAKKRKTSLSILQKQLQQRVAQKPIEAKRWRITSQRLSIGAAAAVLFVVASTFFFMRERAKQDLLNGQPKTVQVEIAPEKETPSSEVPITLTETPASTQSIIDQSKVEQALKQGSTIAMRKSKPLDSVISTSGLENARSNSLQEIAVAKAETERIQLKKSKEAPAENTVVSLNSKAEGITTPNKIANGNANTAILPPELQRIAAQQQQQQANAKVEIDKTPKDNLATEPVASTVLAAKQNGIDTVISSANKVSAVFASTQPAIGWDAYKTKMYDYIQKNAKPSKSGIPTVKLSFVVRPNGDVSKIKVVQSAGKYYDDFTIKILKQNGKWTYSRTSTNQGLLEVVYSF